MEERYERFLQNVGFLHWHIYIFRAKIVIEKKEEEYGFGYIQGN